MREQRGGTLLRVNDARLVFARATFIATRHPQAKRSFEIVSA